MRVEVLICVGLCACGRLGFDPASAPGDAAAILWTGWSPPTQAMGTGVASSDTDWEPALHPSGKVLVFSRTSDFSTSDIFVTTRLTSNGAFAMPQKASFSQGSESGPAWSPDGNTLYFTSGRNSSAQLFTAAFDGSAFTGVNLVAGLEGEPILGVTISPTDLEMFYNDDDVDNPDIRHATRGSTSESWAPAGKLDALASTSADGWPSLSSDGLALFFESSRDSLGGYIYVATRSSPSDDFTTFERVDALDDGGSASGDPDLTPDATQIWFAAERPGGAGGQDIYFANRLP